MEKHHYTVQSKLHIVIIIWGITYEALYNVRKGYIFHTINVIACSSKLHGGLLERENFKLQQNEIKYYGPRVTKVFMLKTLQQTILNLIPYQPTDDFPKALAEIYYFLFDKPNRL